MGVTGLFDGLSVEHAARRADLLAALSQNVPGDHSTITRPDLALAESMFKDKPADLRFLEATMDKRTLQQLAKARVIPIIRTENSQLAVKRALELYELGCKAIEITMDCEDALKIVKKVCEVVGDKCIVGVGTVMDPIQLRQAAKMGAKFAFSPINPVFFLSSFPKSSLLKTVIFFFQTNRKVSL